MSYSLDANILVFASNTASPHYSKATAFLGGCARDPDILCLGWPTVMAYLRLTTHPTIFRQPLTPEEAMKNVNEIISLPHVRMLSEDDKFWDAYQEVTRGQAVRGNMVPDAHLAALLRRHGVDTLYTADADFRRFSFLRVKNPLL